ncbi:hypothetical protein H7K45_16470 [Mycobacterium yunnanensis]|uniref:Uncharacterized protein n=1 Tax=Mycobacterium yunnanensis TaxID=368477 RepID=A0A9X2Z3J0_9MYCO|nr:hypothetical protein [Mycobacterium yunnanensis]MCV7422145.1 hypothetical protein [Mycobacterium yunnanensis]
MAIDVHTRRRMSHATKATVDEALRITEDLSKVQQRGCGQSSTSGWAS